MGKSIIRLIKSNMNSKRIHEQLIIKPGLIYKINFKNMFVGLATIFVSFVLFISVIKYVNCNLDMNSMICMMKDDDNIAKGVLETNNVKINNVDAAVAHIRDGAVYIGVMTAAAFLIESSCLPIGAWLGTVIGMGLHP